MEVQHRCGCPRPRSHLPAPRAGLPELPTAWAAAPRPGKRRSPAPSLLPLLSHQQRGPRHYPPRHLQPPPHHRATAEPGVHGRSRARRAPQEEKGPARPGPATLAAVPLPPRWNVNKAARPGPRGAAAPRAPARLRPLLPNRHHLHPPAAPSIALTTSRRLLPRPLNNEPGPGRAHAPRFARPARLRIPAPSARSARAPGPAPRRLWAAPLGTGPAGGRGLPALSLRRPGVCGALPGASSFPGLCPVPRPAMTKLRFSGVCLHAPLQCFGSRPWHWGIRFLVLPDILHCLGSPSLPLAHLARRSFMSLLGVWSGVTSSSLSGLAPFVRFRVITTAFCSWHLPWVLCFVFFSTLFVILPSLSLPSSVFSFSSSNTPVHRHRALKPCQHGWSKPLYTYTVYY